jgi:hypothetical protein
MGGKFYKLIIKIRHITFKNVDPTKLRDMKETILIKIV